MLYFVYMTTFRNFTNRQGVTYNADKTEVLFAQDLNAITGAINEIEENLPPNLDDVIGGIETDISAIDSRVQDLEDKEDVTTGRKDILRTFQVALVDKTTDVETGTAIGGDFRISDKAVTILGVRAYVDTAGTTGNTVIDINEGGSTLMTTNKITIESTEKSSKDATTQPTLTDTEIVADGIITIDVDSVSTTKPKGLKVAIDYKFT